MMSSELNVSGVWKGILYYPRLLPPLPFDAELREYSGKISGETIEIGDMGPGTGRQLIALLEGMRINSHVCFSKRYDHLGRSDYVVNYDGWLNEDASELAGVWSIPDSWSGSFLMMRGRPNGVSEQRNVAEPVD